MEGFPGRLILVGTLHVLFISVTLHVTDTKDFECFTCTYSSSLVVDDDETYLCINTPGKATAGASSGTCNTTCLTQAEYHPETKKLTSMYRGCGVLGGKTGCTPSVYTNTCQTYCTSNYCNRQPLDPDPTSPPPVGDDGSNGYRDRPPCKNVPVHGRIGVECDPKSKSENFGFSVWLETDSSAAKCHVMSWLIAVAILALFVTQ